ncbi:hypothetical protein DFH27DRAFT_156734 [Peziza echinospora]|nr:hypothetical protein DFH27DRAFT_156734 [Peziza echinospora]
MPGRTLPLITCNSFLPLHLVFFLISLVYNVEFLRLRNLNDLEKGILSFIPSACDALNYLRMENPRFLFFSSFRQLAMAKALAVHVFRTSLLVVMIHDLFWCFEMLHIVVLLNFFWNYISHAYIFYRSSRCMQLQLV